MERNLEILRDAAAGKTEYLSTSQACMVGLALCQPELLEKARYTAAEAWKRIDDEQLAAILEFTRGRA